MHLTTESGYVINSKHMAENYMHNWGKQLDGLYELQS